jgi:hypothetical protein
MARKKFILVWLLSICSLTSLVAQTNLSVPIDHPVYQLITNLELKGILTRVSQIKPYTRHQIRVFLAEAESKSYMLSKAEKNILFKLTNEFVNDFTPQANKTLDILKKGRIDLEGFGSTASIGVKIAMLTHLPTEMKGTLYGQSDFNSPDGGAFVPVGEIDQYYMSIPLTFYISGDAFTSHFSYNMDLTVSFDHLTTYPFIQDGMYRPSGFGFHQNLSGSTDVGNGIDRMEPGLTFGYEMHPELAAAFFDDHFIMRYGILQGGHEVGNGFGGLVLGRQAAPYQSFEIIARLNPSINYYSMLGSLGDYETAWHNKSPIQDNKFISYHNLEFLMSDYFYLSFFEALVWGKRFEPLYLNPLSILLFGQNLSGDVDNSALGFSGAVTLPGIMRLWGEFMIDEFVFDFRSPRSQSAMQLGGKFNIPGLPFTTLMAQYTKIEPYVYSHYAQSYVNNGVTTDGTPILTQTSFDNGGKNLGSYLKPNSDEFRVSIDSMPFPGLTTSLIYSLIRHGTNLPVKQYLGQNGKSYDTQQEAENAGGGFLYPVWGYDDNLIYGDINANLNYGNVGNMGPKSFLHDGIYDWTNMIGVSATYDFSYINPAIPVAITFAYQLGYTFYDFNNKDKIAWPDGTGYSTPQMFGDEFENEWKNIFSIYVRIYI